MADALALPPETPERLAPKAEQFESLEKEADAAHLGMWIFVASELLFFSGFFALYAAYRGEHPQGFGVGVEHNTLIYGSINTAVLLVSSYTIALAVHELRRGARRRAAALIATTIGLGASFLVIKTLEYARHFGEGIYPAGRGRFFDVHADPGTKMFFTLYFCMTGLHALHVIVGMGVLAVLLAKVVHGRLGPSAPHPLAIGAVIPNGSP
jgi:cytochrome c oxidase subunit III